MSLCYLYSESISYPHYREFEGGFENTVFLDFNEIASLDDYDIYIIELNQANKENSQKLVTLFKKKSHTLIYFIIPQNHSLLLFQLTFLLETKSIITHTQDVQKVIAKIKNDKELFVQNNLERWLGSINLKTQNLLIYKNDALVYINHSLLSNFKCEDTQTFQKNILKQVDIKKLLHQDSSSTYTLVDKSSSEHNYIFKSTTVSDHEKIIYIEKESIRQKSLGFMSSRVTFVELLKESILQKDITNKDYSLFTINIQNVKALLHEYKIVVFEELLFDLLSYMDSILENNLIFSQFENDFYVVLFEGLSFDELNTIAEHFYNKVSNYIQHKNNKIILELFLFDLYNHELSNILTTLHEMENAQFNLDDSNSGYIRHLTNKDKILNARNILSEAFKNQIELKILNIYNGLVVNTPAKIVKITNESVYISFESLQGVVLNIEKKTVLQSESFFQDIEAEVKQISLAKKIAILENFTFLKSNANARKFARVTTSIKIPISINSNGYKFSGFILDISIKSIAIKVKNTPQIPVIDLSNVTLVFNLPSKNSDRGYTQLNLEAKVLISTPVDQTGHYKVICDLDQDSTELDIILKYVYERQKELIVELKKMTKLN